MLKAVLHNYYSTITPETKLILPVMFQVNAELNIVAMKLRSLSLRFMDSIGIRIVGKKTAVIKAGQSALIINLVKQARGADIKGKKTSRSG